MSIISGPITLAPTGTTGNNTHTSIQVPDDVESVGIEFTVEAIGATPTVTWKIDASNDTPEVSDANSVWYTAAYNVLADNTVSSASIVTTTVTTVVIFLSRGPAGDKFCRKIRLVTSLNTNVTYRARAFEKDSDS